MSEISENKDLKLSKSDGLPNASESGEKDISRVGPSRDILFYLKNSSHLDDESSKEIKQTYDFVDFVYGKSNTERLSKIIDKVVKKDMEFVKDKTYKEITDWQKQKNPRYRFEDSLYGKMRRTNSTNLAELMLWHMTLLDILNLKCYDLNPDEPLEESIKNAVMKRSDDRLDFLCGNHNLSYWYDSSCFSTNLYKYSKQIFKDLPEKEGIDLQQEQLMRKIFACFVKVAFCKMKQSAKLEHYKNYKQAYDIYQRAIYSFKDHFYLEESPYSDKYVKATEKDVAGYLFLTGELEIMFNNYGDDFFEFFGIRSGCGQGDDGNPVFNEYLSFLNKIEPLESRYEKNNNGFIEKYFPMKLFVTSYYAEDQTECILPYFKDEQLRSSLMKSIKNKFNETDFSDIKQSRNCTERESNLKPSNYFRDIIERFVDGEKYSNALVEGMSVILCQEKDKIVDIQQSSQENNANKLIESPSVNEKEEEPKKTVEYTDLNKDGKSSLNNWIKIENNHKITTKAENKIENGKKNWFFRFVRVVLDFFCRIGSRISNFFCRQLEEINGVGIKNDSVFKNSNGMGSQNSETPKITDSKDKEQKNI